MRQHSRKSEEFTWFDVDLMECSSTQWTPTENSPHATQTPSGRGRVTRVVGEDGSGSISLTLNVATQGYRTLRALNKLDKLNENVVGVGLHKNYNLGLTITYKNMSILSFPPAPGGGTEAATVVITFGFESFDENQDAQVPVVGQ